MADHDLTRFHNQSNEALADALGRVDAIAKAAEAEAQAIKDEIKRRGLTRAEGDSFIVTCTETIGARLDTKAVKEFLGDMASQFERISVGSVIRIKRAERLLAVAA